LSEKRPFSQLCPTNSWVKLVRNILIQINDLKRPIGGFPDASESGPNVEVTSGHSIISGAAHGDVLRGYAPSRYFSTQLDEVLLADRHLPRAGSIVCAANCTRHGNQAAHPGVVAARTGMHLLL
jgi:hypothetical protein